MFFQFFFLHSINKTISYFFIIKIILSINFKVANNTDKVNILNYFEVII